MSTISLLLPDALYEEVRKLAESEDVSINELATMAIAEKVAVMKTSGYMSHRAFLAYRENFLRAMAKVPDETPDERDAL